MPLWVLRRLLLPMETKTRMKEKCKRANLSDDQIASAQVGQALTLFKKEQTQTLRMLPDII